MYLLAPYMIAVGNHEQVHVAGGEKDPIAMPLEMDSIRNGATMAAILAENVGYLSIIDSTCQIMGTSLGGTASSMGSPTSLCLALNITSLAQYTWLVNELESIDHLRTP